MRDNVVHGSVSCLGQVTALELSNADFETLVVEGL
jgi:hypothetical protein